MLIFLLFCILIAVIMGWKTPEERESFGKAILALGGVVVFCIVAFYGFGFYLYESSRSSAQVKAQVYCAAHGNCSTPVKATAEAVPSVINNPLPECNDPYQPYQTDTPLCAWHENLHKGVR